MPISYSGMIKGRKSAFIFMNEYQKHHFPLHRHPSILTMYDVAYSWLSLVNQSLADNTDPRSGRNLFQKARNMTFTGKWWY